MAINAIQTDIGMISRSSTSFLASPSLTRGRNLPASRHRKRLIVLCDGTWQDSTNTTEGYPSNVARLGRALSKYAFDDKGKEVEQIVFYQKGVGTGLGDKLTGGAFGYGVSANVRAAYYFLAHNYDEGDDIYFFGFSRGAYTARAVASLVAETGLLTKLGMDQFGELYDTYYSSSSHGKGRSETPEAKRKAKEYVQGLRPEQISHAAADAIRIVGVWDTVAFHKPIFSNIRLLELLGFQFNQERIEFSDTDIPSRIQYGFHALSLDETRNAYSPTMWTLPSRPDSARRQPILKQVWFSGEHTDVGGGRYDHRLSDIALAWMISECSRTRLLAFEPSYLLMRSYPGDIDPLELPWATRHGQTQGSTGLVAFLSKMLEGVMGRGARRPLSSSNMTNETIHASIFDRRFGTNNGPRHAARYDSCNVVGWSKKGWEVKSTREGHRVYLKEEEVGKVEEELKGKIRSANSRE